MASVPETTDLEERILAGWRALMSPCEAERIGSTTLMVLAYEAARAVTRAAAGTGRRR